MIDEPLRPRFNLLISGAELVAALSCRACVATKSQLPDGAELVHVGYDHRTGLWLLTLESGSYPERQDDDEIPTERARMKDSPADRLAMALIAIEQLGWHPNDETPDLIGRVDRWQQVVTRMTDMASDALRPE